MKKVRRIKGHGIVSWIKKSAKKVFNLYQDYQYRKNAILNFYPRENDATGRFKKFLDENGDKPITSVQVGRHPINENIQKALNILSLGKFNKEAERMDYDSIYHQYMIINYKDGTSKKVERNHVVEAFDVNEKDKGNVFVDIPINKQLDTNALLNNASLNNDMFWKYDSSKSNCQIFVRDIIDKNNLIPQTDASKILQTQDAQRLINTIPLPLREIPLLITNIASAADKVINGAGIQNNNIVRLMIDGLI